MFSLHLQQIEICSDRYDRLWQVQQIVTDSVILQISLKLMELICNFKVLLCKTIVITVISNLVKKYFISEQKWQFWKNRIFAEKLSPPLWERPICWLFLRLMMFLFYEQENLFLININVIFSICRLKHTFNMWVKF